MEDECLWKHAILGGSTIDDKSAPPSKEAAAPSSPSPGISLLVPHTVVLERERSSTMAGLSAQDERRVTWGRILATITMATPVADDGPSRWPQDYELQEGLHAPRSN